MAALCGDVDMRAAALGLSPERPVLADHSPGRPRRLKRSATLQAQNFKCKPSSMARSLLKDAPRLVRQPGRNTVPFLLPKRKAGHARPAQNDQAFASQARAKGHPAYGDGEAKRLQWLPSIVDGPSFIGQSHHCPRLQHMKIPRAPGVQPPLGCHLNARCLPVTAPVVPEG